MKKKTATVTATLTPEQQKEMEDRRLNEDIRRNALQAAKDAAAFARAAWLNFDLAEGDGVGKNEKLIKLAVEGMAAAELLEDRATKLAKGLQKMFTERRKAAAVA